MAKMTVYDMIRAKAKDMGHNAANIPDKVLERCVEENARQMNLLGAKLYLENYMMGNINPADFARVMAANDQLRYTVSDLCRMKLEPQNLELPKRNNSYIDVGAGLKTFWTEMKVPLPSEQQAARDLRNIALGVEAGRRNGQPEQQAEQRVEAGQKEKPKRRSFRDILSNAKQHAAAAAIEKLTPIAEGKGRKLDESWLETEDGKVYKEEYTRKVAQQVENVVMDVEAGLSPDLAPEERVKAMQAAGMDETSARHSLNGMFADERISRLEKNIENEYRENKGFAKEPRSTAELSAAKETIPTEEYYTDLYKLKVLQENDPENPKAEKLDSQTLGSWRDQLQSEYKAELDNQPTKPLRSLYREDELEETTEADMHKMFTQQVEVRTSANLRSGYSGQELSSSTNTQMEALFRQINQHMGIDTKSEPQEQATKSKQQRRREDRAYGTFEGKEVSFKNKWSSHTFTDDEVQKLFAGETISFEYQNKNNETKTASGKLEWQEHDGKPFLGFKAEFGKKREASDSLFTEQDEALMNQYSGGTPEEQDYFNDPFAGMDPDEYQRQLEEDMRNYQAEESQGEWEYQEGDYVPEEARYSQNDEEGSGLTAEDLNFGTEQDAQVL